MCYANPEDFLKFFIIVILTDLITSTSLWLFWYIEGCFESVIEEQQHAYNFAALVYD